MPLRNGEYLIEETLGKFAAFLPTLRSQSRPWFAKVAKPSMWGTALAVPALLRLVVSPLLVRGWSVWDDAFGLPFAPCAKSLSSCAFSWLFAATFCLRLLISFWCIYFLRRFGDCNRQAHKSVIFILRTHIWVRPQPQGQQSRIRVRPPGPCPAHPPPWFPQTKTKLARPRPGRQPSNYSKM